MATGGFGEHVVRYFNEKNTLKEIKVQNIALEDVYVEHGNVEILKKEHGIDAESVVKRIVANYVRK